MNWLYYLLEANLYLVLFYGFYRLFLQNETFYNLNRYFLLLGTLLSFALPVLQLGPLKPAIIHDLGAIPMGSSTEMEEVSGWYVLYLLIAFGFAVKLSFSIYKIITLWVKAKKHTAGDITLVEVKDESTAFSFFNLLFIHPALANQPTVLKHEMVHIKQKHSFDVIFFELVQVICWFNPIIHFVKKDIKLLHEYIADELTTSEDVHKHEYALFLIQNSFGLKAQPITNQIFNQSILKRRINMLNKKRTAGWARLRLLLALPLTGSMLCMSTMAFTKDYGYVDLLPEKSELAISPYQESPKVERNKPIDTLKLKKATKTDQIKFPPPIARLNKPIKGLKTPPSPPKTDQIKFPPPIVKTEKLVKAAKTPPPPVEPPPPRKTDRIKFPPPIVKPDQTVKGSETPPPPVEAPPPPKVEVVKFPPPVVKPDAPKFKTKESQTPPPPVEPPAPKFRTKKAASPPPPVEPPPPKFRTKKSTAVKTPPPPVDPATKPLTKN